MNMRAEPTIIAPRGTPPEGRIEEEKPERLSVESRKLDIETRKRATEKGMALMKEILSPIETYAVFASTGMYLQGKAKDLPELQTLPGDFDVVVAKERDLQILRERLGNVPGVRFKHDGGFKRFPGEDTRVLSGFLPIEERGPTGKPLIIDYEFEIFWNSRIVTDRIIDEREPVLGFQVLTLEGLSNQYMNNLAFETAIEESSTEVVRFLTDPIHEPFIRAEIERWQSIEDKSAMQASEVLIDLTNELELGPTELLEFYAEIDNYRGMNADQDPEVATSTMAKILSGQKTKVRKRTDDLGKLGAVRRPSEQPASGNGLKKAA